MLIIPKKKYVYVERNAPQSESPIEAKILEMQVGCFTP